MSFKDFRVIETIGKGSFASVYKVIRKSDNKVYALKRVKISKMSKKEIADALNEIRFLASIRHKNIVGFLHAFLENNDSELCIIMEYCGCGDLAQKVERYKKKKQYIDEQVIWKYLIQCLKALHHLHEKGICHRDLKVANTFLAEDGSVKIGDMNVSKRLKKGQLQTQIGTPYYMSPEIWNNKPYDSRSDIWSLGCMIYELCALRPPFLGDSFPSLKRAITAGRYPSIPSKYSEALQNVIANMLKLNSRDRPSADMLLKSPEVTPRLSLDDESSTSFANNGEKREKMILELISTIKVPQNLNKLQCALPKPCYPDLRPNSPSSWTVAEQKHVFRKPPPLPPVPNIPTLPMDQLHNKENNFPPPTIPTHRSEDSISSNVSKHPIPPSIPTEGGEAYSRRPLAPTNRSNTNQQHPAFKNPGNGYHKATPYHPSLDPINNNTPAVIMKYPQPPIAPSSARPPAGNPTRVQYHHRVW